MTSEGKMKAKVNRDSVNLHDNEVLTLLEGLRLAFGKTSTDPFDVIGSQTFIPDDTFDMDSLTVSDTMQCSSCNVTFTDREDQVQHYKTDWHRFNLKRRLRDQNTVSEEQFEEITGDISSISGSGSDDCSDKEDSKETLKLIESDDDDDDDDYDIAHIEGVGRRHPKVFFFNQQNNLLSLYRCIIHGKKNKAESVEDLISMTTSLPKQTKWIIMMLAGGHFAAAVFDKGEVVTHKTFHRYVVRAKRGTIQSSRDGQGNAPKSAGASIRRYNEAALEKDMDELVECWSEHMKTCNRIFLRAPSSNKVKFFRGKRPLLDKQDTRIRMVPFQTRRPTFKEIKRVHQMLSSVDVYAPETTLEDIWSPSSSPSKPDSQKKASKVHKEKEIKDKKQANPADDQSEGESTDEDVTLMSEVISRDTTDLQEFEINTKPKKRKKKKTASRNSPEVCVQNENFEKETPIYNEEETRFRDEMYTACKTGNKEMLCRLLDKYSSSGTLVDADKEAVNYQYLLNTDYSSNTLLHLAAQGGHQQLIQPLLGAGVDPTVKNKHKQTAYISATDKETRNEFRRFRAVHPDKYNYTEAQVPGPLTDEIEAERKSKDNQRRKAQKQARRERLKDSREEQKKLRKEDEEKKRYLALSDREKRALAAEKRYVQQLTSENKDNVVLSRCFQCGSDITGKVPFEYYDYKFCSPSCLKQHKQNKSTKS